MQAAFTGPDRKSDQGAFDGRRHAAEPPTDRFGSCQQSKNGQVPDLAAREASLQKAAVLVLHREEQQAELQAAMHCLLLLQ